MDRATFFETYGGVAAVAARLKEPRTTVTYWRKVGVPRSRVSQVRQEFKLSADDALELCASGPATDAAKPDGMQQVAA